MNFPDIDPQRLAYVLSAVHAQVMTALWLSAGMVLATLGLIAIAAGFRKIALLFGLAYSATLFFVHNGHALVLGPLGCAVALIGLLWPGLRARQASRPPAGQTEGQKASK